MLISPLQLFHRCSVDTYTGNGMIVRPRYSGRAVPEICGSNPVSSQLHLPLTVWKKQEAKEADFLFIFVFFKQFTE